MDYQNLVRDFAHRTRYNLDTLRNLQKTKPDLEVYEVTQLINSMLGLLVFPQQRYFDHIPKTPLTELANQGWPIPEVEGHYPQVKDLRELVRYLRNAITHCNLEFLSDEGEEISGLRVWNTNPQNNQTTWKARLMIEDIEKITNKFIQLLLEE
jgi:hypothetical protein